jgi:anti-sigma factor RsiW
MTMPQADANRHLRDADLMRLLDGEESPLERTRNAAHLAACARCAAEAQRLGADAATVRGWLDRAEFESLLPATAAAAADHSAGSDARRSPRPPVSVGPAWLKAAAVLLFIAAPVAAIPALRERIVAAFADPTPAAAPATPTGAEAAALASTAATIRFEPAPGVFSVSIDAAQADGTLRVQRSAGEHAVLTTDGAVGAGPVVSATALHIRNDPASSATYSLHVPAGVNVLVVHIGGRLAASLDATALSAGVELPVR